MAATLVDLVKITCTSAGAGSFHLGSAVTGFFGVDELTDGATYGYSVQQGADKEYGHGAFDLASLTLTRDVIKSSLGTDPIPFTASAQIGFVLLAEDIGSGGGGGAVINDAIISPNFVWSSSKTNAQILASASTLAISISDLATATSNALATKEPTIVPGLVSQFWRGDKTWVVPDKSSVGLANVDNTSDVNKPVSTAQAAALALKENQALTIATTSATTFTLNSTYRNQSLETTAATPVAAVFDPAMPAGAWGYVMQRGAGQVAFTTTGTGTVRGVSGTRSRGQWGVVRWYCSANSNGASAEIILSDETMAYDQAVLNMLPANPGLAINEGLTYAAPYLYVTPHNDFIVAKIDPRTMAVISTLDLSTVDPTFVAMSDSFAVANYLYILPHQTSTGPYYQTKVVRVDLNNFTAGGVTSLVVVPTSSISYTPRDGFTDGTWGYVNIRWPLAGIAVHRFGLGANFTLPNVSTLQLTATTGADGVYPIVQGNFICCDATYLYAIALANTRPPTDPLGRLGDLWLVKVPLNDFTVGAAIFTRITHQNFVGSLVPVPYQMVDDGTNLWTPANQLGTGSGIWLPVLKIPKANPSATVVTTLPAGQLSGITTSGTGAAIYDGARYGYVIGDVAAKIAQIDTQQPGVVNYIDFSSVSGGTALWGMERVGNQAFAVSFFGANGILARFTLLPS